MDLLPLFRSFLPLRNPLGFGASDFVELVLAAALVLFAVASRAWIEPYARRLAERTGWSMLLLLVLPVALRLSLLPQYPIPSPGVSDDFSYLLLADTLRHFRLANPAHPLHQFFETFFVLQEPSYSSIFPLGQGIALAIGWMIFGHPWAGVALSVGAFCALCYWMLRSWTTPVWALAGGLLAAIEFGPLNQWMNSYWGGAVSGIAGCLVFGSLPPLLQAWRRRDAAFLGLGFGLQLLSRPFESIFLLLSAILFLLPALRNRVQLPRVARAAVVVALAVLPAIALTLAQNRAVTRNWFSMPYMLSRDQYGVPATFTVQPNPVPHRPLTREQELDYEAQSAAHGAGADTFSTYWDRFAGRLRFYRFFLLAPLYLAIPFFLARLREFRFACVVGALLLFALGTNFYPYFYSHYIAAVACLFVLVSVAGLERLSAFSLRDRFAGGDAARLILFLCGAHFLLWYGVHASRDEDVIRQMTQYETWDAINHGDPEGRIAINRRLAASPGQQLVFVRYWPQHQFQEWVHNAADIDSARVVWARDLGTGENEKLRRYYPGRTVWLLEPDARPPRLTAYPAASP
ncbi:MAG TPA: hypothetical protein VEV17_01975 [Bryobacteraceae bacterium]|nr:hypothetical protein [Bryobacteraceae bacterium]